MSEASAARLPDDVAETASEAERALRAPLIIREPLERFLDARGVGSGPLTATPIGEGHSNVTYLLERDGARVVLRRSPRPPFPPSAHDMVREAKLLATLGPAGVRVPEIVAICEDEGVIGAPFYVMEHIDAYEVSGELPLMMRSIDARVRFGMELVDALVEIHAVDAADPALARFGRPAGYLERQVRRFSSIWSERRTRDLPEVDRVAAWLAASCPEPRHASVVHGDFRLGNVLYGGPMPKLRAVLDWEMATLGDPLADVGYLLATWAEPDDEDNPMLALSAVTRLPGFMRRDELLARYVRAGGMDVEPEDLRWYEVLALWKCTIFLEASYARYREGTTDDPYFATLAAGVPALARAAIRRMLG